MNITSDTIALVTGASRGLGYATAVELAKQGAHVITMARTVGGLEELDDAIKAVGGSATLVPLDITDEEGLQRMCLSIFERWGKLDLLVHCAAHAEPLAPVPHVSDKNFARCMNVNALGTQRIIALTDPLLRASKDGTAVFIEDHQEGKKFFSAYAASKAAAQAVVDAWALETANLAPRVLTFAPKAMPTGLRAQFFPGEERDKLSAPETEAKRLMELL